MCLENEILCKYGLREKYNLYNYFVGMDFLGSHLPIKCFPSRDILAVAVLTDTRIRSTSLHSLLAS